MGTAVTFDAPPSPPVFQYSFHATPTTWTDARAQCEAAGGQLGAVRNQADQDALAVLLSGGSVTLARTLSPTVTLTLTLTPTPTPTPPQDPLVWIGASDSTSEDQWRWTDGTSVSFFAWGLFQPVDVGNEDCVAISRAHSWRWYDDGCDKIYPYICSPFSPPVPPALPAPPASPPAPPSPPPSPLRPGASTSYLLSTSLTSPDPGPLQWANAKAYCEGLNMQLAIVRTAADQLSLNAAMLEAPTTQLFWIGLSRTSASAPFLWTDGTTPEYFNWADNQPDASSLCVNTYASSDWKWGDVKCNGGRAFICSSLSPPPAPPMLPAPPAAPPSPVSKSELSTDALVGIACGGAVGGILLTGAIVGFVVWRSRYGVKPSAARSGTHLDGGGRSTPGRAGGVEMIASPSPPPTPPWQPQTMAPQIV